MTTQATNIAELKTYGASMSDGDSLEILGYSTAGDGGGGTFYWDATSTETDNGGTIIQATGVTTGRWIRAYDGAVNTTWFGVDNTGATDESTKLSDIFNNFANVYVPTGLYLCKDITLSSRVSITGDRSDPYTYSGASGTVFTMAETATFGFEVTGHAITIENIALFNSYSNKISHFIGVGGAAGAFDLIFRGIQIKGACTYGFHLPNTWASLLENCRVEGLQDTGFFFDLGTSWTVNSCLAYNSLVVGWSLKSLFYCSFNSCGTDSGLHSLWVRTDNSSITFNSFGSEGMTGRAIIIGGFPGDVASGSNNGVTFNSHFVGSSGSTVASVYLNQISSTGAVIFNGLTMPSNAYPSTNTFFEANNNNVKPVLSGSYLSFTDSTISGDDVVLVGSNWSNIDSLNTNGLVASLAPAASVQLFTPIVGGHYLVTADNSSGERFCYGVVMHSSGGVIRYRPSTTDSGLNLVVNGLNIDLNNTLGATTLINITYRIQLIGSKTFRRN